MEWSRQSICFVSSEFVTGLKPNTTIFCVGGHEQATLFVQFNSTFDRTVEPRAARAAPRRLTPLSRGIRIRQLGDWDWERGVVVSGPYAVTEQSDLQRRNAWTAFSLRSI